MAVRLLSVAEISEVPRNKIIEEMRFFIEGRHKCFPYAILTDSLHLCNANGEIETPVSVKIEEITPISYLIRK